MHRLASNLITCGTRVKTPYGDATVVDINPAFGVKVIYDSLGTDWHAFPYVEIAPPKREKPPAT